MSSQGLSGNFPEDDVGRDALSELAKLTKESHLNSQHILEPWTQCQRANRSPNLTSGLDCGLHTCIEQAPLPGKRLAAPRVLFGAQLRCCTLATLATALQKLAAFAARIMKNEAQVLEGGRLFFSKLGQHMLPDTPRARSCAIETPVLKRLMVRPRPWPGTSCTCRMV